MGCSRMNAISIIRAKRSGALNLVQTNFLLEYKDPNDNKNKGENATC